MATTSTPVIAGSGPKDGNTGKVEDPPANAVNAVPAKKQPPPEKPEEIRMRSFVLLSFWAIIVFLGLPIWWKTTTIYRAELPLSQMMDWADGRVCDPFDLSRFN
jgi:phosphatidylinositol glycan class S